MKKKKSIAKVRNRPQNRGCKLVYDLRVVIDGVKLWSRCHLMGGIVGLKNKQVTLELRRDKGAMPQELDANRKLL